MWLNLIGRKRNLLRKTDVQHFELREQFRATPLIVDEVTGVQKDHIVMCLGKPL